MDLAGHEHAVGRQACTTHLPLAGGDPVVGNTHEPYLHGARAPLLAPESAAEAGWLDVDSLLEIPLARVASAARNTPWVRLRRGGFGFTLAMGQRNLQHQCLATAAGYVGSGIAHGGLLLLLGRLGAGNASSPWAVLAVVTGLEAGLTAGARVALGRSLGSAGQASPAVQRQLWRMMTATAGATTAQNVGLAAAAWGLSSDRAAAGVVAGMAIVARIGEAGTAGMLQALGADTVTTLVPTPPSRLSPRLRDVVACGESLWRSFGANLPALAGLVAARQLGGTAGAVLSAVVGTMSLGAAISSLPTLLALAALQHALAAATAQAGVGGMPVA